MKARILMAIITITALLSAPSSYAADDIGIFETVYASDVSIEETAAALDASFATSSLALHFTHDVRLPDETHRARVKEDHYNKYKGDGPARMVAKFRTFEKSQLEILVVREASRTRVLHYGQMWRMQLYFRDSGYRAFTANVGAPSALTNSIADTVGGS